MDGIRDKRGGWVAHPLFANKMIYITPASLDITPASLDGLTRNGGGVSGSWKVMRGFKMMSVAGMDGSNKGGGVGGGAGHPHLQTK